MAPTVSVVMGVYNAERTLKAAVESILSQSFSDFELIVVNDGSTDKTQEILADFARRDARVRVVTQTNQGLTRSLILGCELASGRYIARQDADDVSMPDRFMQQVALLEEDSSAVLASCWVEDVSPEGVSCAVHKELQHSLRLSSGVEHQLTGIAAHGSVLMRRCSLMDAGGYRACFYYAQDSDLWLRLSQRGAFRIAPIVLYRRTIGMGSISSRFSSAQSRFCELAQECFRAIRDGRSEQVLISEAEKLASDCRQRRSEPATPAEAATSLMLIASQLFRYNPKLAREYLWKAIRTYPLHWRSWKALICSSFRRQLPETERSNGDSGI